MLSENEINELEIQKNIFNRIDSFESFRFNAGAGAGKTYALIESLKHILINKSKSLINNKQKVICISYTNVAKDEIQTRLSYSRLVNVSTIHEFLWSIICNHQKELTQIHKAKIESELIEIESLLADNNNKLYAKFASLGLEEQNAVCEFIINTREDYYENLDAKSAAFRHAITSLNAPDIVVDLLKNVNSYKQTAKNIIKRHNYNNCIVAINAGEKNSIVYDTNNNSDRLASMKISHDTVIEYSYKLITKKPELLNVLVKSFPYIFIDEYQDTNAYVIRLIQMAHVYALKKNIKWLVGYFGDTAQCIYDGGVGKHINKIHASNLTNIDKGFNRRSHNQVIDVINRIRNDSIQQTPIFDDRDQGNVTFSFSNTSAEDDKIEITKRFLKKRQVELLKQNNKNKIHCLVLTNKMLANLSGFGSVYSAIQSTKAIYWNELNSQLLSQDTHKLHPGVLEIYKLIEFFKMLHSKEASFVKIFGHYDDRMTYAQAIAMINSLKEIKLDSLTSIIKGLSDVHDKHSDNYAFKLCMSNHLEIVPSDIRLYDSFAEYLNCYLHDLFFWQSFASKRETYTKELHVKPILDVKYDAWFKWVNHINKVEDGHVVFHTYHSTKGEEYQNVCLIMEPHFGKQKNMIRSFFQFQQLDDTNKEIVLNDPELSEQHENTKNLLYVACSRAIKNMNALYLGDVQGIEKGIKSIFGEKNRIAELEDESSIAA